MALQSSTKPCGILLLAMNILLTWLIKLTMRAKKEFHFKRPIKYNLLHVCASCVALQYYKRLYKYAPTSFTYVVSSAKTLLLANFR